MQGLRMREFGLQCGKLNPIKTFNPHPSGSSGANMPAILNLHNSLRAKHSASPLSWSPELASAAQAWADRCVFQHSGGGENLAQYFQDPISAVQVLL
jgi:uncharacterized protein YkwD